MITQTFVLISLNKKLGISRFFNDYSDHKFLQKFFNILLII